MAAPQPSHRWHSRLAVGRIGGIQVTLDWTLVGIFALLTWALATAIPDFEPGTAVWARWVGGAAATTVFLASLLVHELSHSLVARRRGIEVQDIRLWLLGGISTLEGEPKTPRDDFDIAIAGPMTS